LKCQTSPPPAGPKPSTTGQSRVSCDFLCHDFTKCAHAQHSATTVPLILLLRADTYGQSGRFAEAARDYRAAIAASPTDSTAWAALSQILKEHPQADDEGSVNWTSLAAGMSSALATTNLLNEGGAAAKLHFALFTAHDMRRREFSITAVEAAADEAEAAALAWQHLGAANKFEFRKQETERFFYETKQVRSVPHFESNKPNFLIQRATHAFSANFVI
jgi:tetratricopeptide (TPR) repeat protein